MSLTYVSHSIFDKLFKTTNNEQMFIFIVIAFVTSVDITVLNGFCGCLRLPMGDSLDWVSKLVISR